jgi:hypothetical protein
MNQKCHGLRVSRYSDAALEVRMITSIPQACPMACHIWNLSVEVSQC